MAIQLRGSLQGTSLSRFGIHIPSLYMLTLSGFDVGFIEDPISSRLSRCIFDTGFAVTTHAFGLSAFSSGTVDRTLFPAHKPFNTRYNYLFDRRAYSTFLGDVFSVAESTEYNTGSDSSGYPERNVKHLTSGGLLDSTRIHSLVTKNSGFDAYAKETSGLFFTDVFHRHGLSGIDPTFGTYELYEADPVDVHQFAHDFLRSFATDYEAQAVGPFPNSDGSANPSLSRRISFFTGSYPYWGVGIENFEVGWFTHTLPSSISYTLYGYDYYGHELCADITISFQYTGIDIGFPQSMPCLPRPILSIGVSVGVKLCRLFLTGNPEDNITFPGWLTILDSYRIETHSTDIMMISEPSPATGLSTNPIKDLYYSRAPDIQSAFYREVLKNLRDIRPSSFHAVRDAVDSYTNVVQTNHIETLAELDELLTLLPSFNSLKEFAVSLASGRPIKAATDGLDFLSEAYLSYKFGIEPTISNGQEILDKASSVRERLNHLYGPRTLHGKFLYEFPEGTFGLPKTLLISRAKLRIHFDESALLAGVLGSRAVGLFPSLASLWDVVPLSFVIDWFTNMGERFDALDDQVSILAFRVTKCVYSYTVIAPLDDDFLQPFDLVAATSVTPYLKAYIRELSFMKPVMRESKFDWLSPSSQLDIGLVGSLLWQVLTN